MLSQETLALSSICSVLFRCAYELLCFWMRREGIEIFHRSPLWENNGSMQFVETEKWPEMEFTIAAGTKVCLLRFRIEDLRKIVYMTSLCGVWWCSNTIFMANTLPKLKKSSSWMISSVWEEEVLTCVRVHSQGIKRSKYYGAITKRMNLTCSSIEPNDNNLELNAIAYTFSKIDSNLNFNNSFGDRELLASVSLVFPHRRTRKLKN